MTSTMKPDEIRDTVRHHYAEVARTQGACGCGPGCCTTGAGVDVDAASRALGYDAGDLAAVEGANMGLGCGTPLAFASLREGDVVLDLGSGGGIDCLLAARQVGTSGRVIGVDMTPEMIAKARDNAARVGAHNVELRLGEIERLPVADRSVDVVVSNCVINLSPDKPAVLREVYRALRPGGRLAIADIVASHELPDEIARNAAAFAGCIAGAASVSAMRSMLSDAGFVDVRVDVNEKSASFIKDWAPGSHAEAYVASAHITARRPTGAGCCGTDTARGGGGCC
jgi:arsenite methyltransferase